MNVDLTDTNASAIQAALTSARRHSGTAALGMVLTLVVDVEEQGHYDALRAAHSVAHEHPCRIITVIRRPAKGAPRLDAELQVGHEGALGETIMLRLYGTLRQHADSVVLPLLLPDAPVVVWWPGPGPKVPCDDAVGALAQRRVTDAAGSARPLHTLQDRLVGHMPGDTDLSWTRLTPWRTLLAAALDQRYDPVASASVSGARGNPSAELLACWLESRLGVPVERRTSKGPGITAVRLHTQRGDIALTRPDGRLATLSRPGQPDRRVTLPRRSVTDLLAEELRRLDPDEVYAETLGCVANGRAKDTRRPAKSTTPATSSKTGRTSRAAKPAKAAARKPAPARSPASRTQARGKKP